MKTPGPRLIPDWEKETVVLAWPTVRADYVRSAQTLKPFFRHLVLILDQLRVPTCLLVSSPKDLANLRHRFPGSISMEYVPGLGDLWLRDSAPWLVTQGKSRYLWQPQFDPPYLSAEPVLRSVRPVLESFFRHRLANFRCRGFETQLDWKWEGGNATSNGAGVIIATEAVLLENHGTQSGLEQVCRALGARPIIIPAEPGDVLSHSDGTVRFWSRDEILISDLTGVPGLSARARRKTEKYMDQLVGVLTANGFLEEKIKLVPCGPYAEHSGLDGIPSARGCYINYLRTRDLILVPAFGDRRQDQKALNFFRSIESPGGMVVPIDCRLLSDFGGGLNCLAATY